jgi:hypothetical protein
VLHALAQHAHIHPQCIIGWNPAYRVRSDACQVRGLLDPGVGFRGTVHTQARRAFVAKSVLSNVLHPGCARGKQAHEVRHVAAAHEKPAAVARITDQLRDPANGLRFDLRADRRQSEAADVGIHSRREKVRQNSDMRR